MAAGLMLPTLIGAAARAQDTPGEKPLAAKAGFFFPTDSAARDAGGNGMLLLEVDYTLQTLIDNSTLLGHTSIGIGYTERRDLRIIPITLSETFRDSRAAPGTGYYYGVGLGLYLTRLESGSTSGDTKNLFGGYAVGGVSLGSNLFAEAKYHLISRYDGKNVSGIQVTIGTRF